MADSADRRSEGKNSKKYYNERKALGLCVYCGVQSVKNRVTCYSCIDERYYINSLSGFRNIVNKTLKTNNATLEKTISDLKKIESDSIFAIIELLELAKVKKPGRPLSEFTVKCYNMRMSGSMPKDIAKILNVEVSKVNNSIHNMRKSKIKSKNQA